VPSGQPLSNESISSTTYGAGEEAGQGTNRGERRLTATTSFALDGGNREINDSKTGSRPFCRRSTKSLKFSEVPSKAANGRRLSCGESELLVRLRKS
jgi:hypothetical protein